VSAGVLWLYIKQKFNKQRVVVVLGVLMVLDLVLVDWNYVNADNFVSAKNVENPINKSNIDKEILQDKGYYRVANFEGGIMNAMNDGRTSYYHKSIGGYHAAKPGRYQELFDYQIAKNNIEALNMLNTKYIIYAKEDATAIQINPEALGPVWFVKAVKFVDSPNEEMLALNTFTARDTAIINKTEFPEAPAKFKNLTRDSIANIRLTKYDVNVLSYKSVTKLPQLAVFSEMYYKEGWQAYIDGEKVPIYRADYVLRALKIPSGTHTIVFKFEPKVIQQGTMLTGISYILLIGFILGWYFYDRKKST